MCLWRLRCPDAAKEAEILPRLISTSTGTVWICLCPARSNLCESAKAVRTGRLPCLFRLVHRLSRRKRNVRNFGQLSHHHMANASQPTSRIVGGAAVTPFAHNWIVRGSFDGCAPLSALSGTSTAQPRRTQPMPHACPRRAAQTSAARRSSTRSGRSPPRTARKAARR